MARLQNGRSEEQQLQAEQPLCGWGITGLHLRLCNSQLIHHLCALPLDGVSARCDVEVAALQQRGDGGSQRRDLRLTGEEVAVSGLKQLQINEEDWQSHTNK